MSNCLITKQIAIWEYARVMGKVTGNYDQESGKIMFDDMDVFTVEDRKLSIDDFSEKHIVPLVQSEIRC